jgi:hypothetical protein
MMLDGVALRRYISLTNTGAETMSDSDHIEAGYKAFTGYVFTAEQAAAYNAAVDKARRNPSEANLNGAHNLFYSIALTGMRDAG